MKPCDSGPLISELETIAVGKRFGELLLVRHKQNATDVAAEVAQFLNHDLASLTIEAAEALVDDHRFDRSMLTAGVLADAERQADGDTKSLAAAEESGGNGIGAGGVVKRFELQGFFEAAVLALAESEPQLTAAEPIENDAGMIDDRSFGLADEVALQTIAAEQFDQGVMDAVRAIGLTSLIVELLTALAAIGEAVALLNALAPQLFGVETFAFRLLGEFVGVARKDAVGVGNGVALGLQFGDTIAAECNGGASLGGLRQLRLRIQSFGRGQFPIEFSDFGRR